MIYYFLEYHLNNEGQEIFDGVVATQNDDLYFKFKNRKSEQFWKQIGEVATVKGVPLLRYHIDDTNIRISRSELMKETEEQDIKAFLRTKFDEYKAK